MGAGVTPPLAAVGRLPTTLTLFLALLFTLKSRHVYHAGRWPPFASALRRQYSLFNAKKCQVKTQVVVAAYQYRGICPAWCLRPAGALKRKPLHPALPLSISGSLRDCPRSSTWPDGSSTTCVPACLD